MTTVNLYESTALEDGLDLKLLHGFWTLRIVGGGLGFLVFTWQLKKYVCFFHCTQIIKTM